MVGNRKTSPFGRIFFFAALSADLYEHFLHASPNSIFMVTGPWTVGFDASVFVLLALEVLGCFLGILCGGGWSHPRAA